MRSLVLLALGFIASCATTPGSYTYEEPRLSVEQLSGSTFRLSLFAFVPCDSSLAADDWLNEHALQACGGRYERQDSTEVEILELLDSKSCSASMCSVIECSSGGNSKNVQLPDPSET
jgi:hypothetical protein